MPIRNIELERQGGDGTGYTYELHDVVDPVADLAALPNDTFFKYYEYKPDVDVVMYKDSAGNIINPYLIGAGDLNFTFTQGVAAAIWNVAHNLGKKPSVSVVDSGDNEVIGEVVHTDINNLIIITLVQHLQEKHI